MEEWIEYGKLIINHMANKCGNKISKYGRRDYRAENAEREFSYDMEQFIRNGDYIYADKKIPEEVLNSSEFKEQMIKMFMNKARNLEIKVEYRAMLEIIEKFPKAIEYIDMLNDKFGTGNSGRDELLMEIVKKNPEILDILSKEKLEEISLSYAKDREKWKQLYVKDQWRLSEGHEEKFIKGESNFILQLIKTNPEVLHSENIQNMIKENPELAKQVEIFRLTKEKEKNESTINEIKREELENGAPETNFI